LQRRLSPSTPAVAAALALLLAACGSGGGAGNPDWKPQPSFSGEAHLPKIEPALPTPAGPGQGSQAPPPVSSSPRQSPSPSPSEESDPQVVAKKVNAPTGITVMPDHSALVAERATGRVLRVQPKADQPVETVRTLIGSQINDLTLSPNYAEDNLIYAYVTTKTDNRVVTFTLKGAVTPVLVGIPKGATNNAGRIAFDSIGELYVATGDAGAAADATDPKSLAGKVLRVTDIGDPVPSNPTTGSAVFASGLHAPAGICTNVPDLTDPNKPVPEPTGKEPVLEVEAGKGGVVLVNQVRAGKWLQQAPDDALATLPAGFTYPGGCAIFDEALYVTSLDGQQLLRAELTISGSQLTVGKWEPIFKDKRYGRLLTVTAGTDGSLWLATSNKDGKGKPVADDERIIRIMASGGGGNSPV